MMSKIPIGISSCLLGQEVRYNGGHSRSQLCVNQLNDYFEYMPFCPEVAAGFGTPRPVMRLVGDTKNPTLIYSDKPETDLTAQLENGFTPYLSNCAAMDGYILMKNSPSCGMERVKIYGSNGYPQEEKGQGLFAAALMRQFPLLPVEEEGRLNDSRLRENFILRVYAHYHFRNQVIDNPVYHNLIQYHSSYKYLLLAHDQEAYRSLGRMLAESSQRDLQELLQEYFTEFMAAMSKPASRGGHCNVMLHILGYLKKSVPGEARQNIQDVIFRYQKQEVNLITPITLLAHYIKQYGSEYIRAQRYLEPYPAALGLRNQV